MLGRILRRSESQYLTNWLSSDMLVQMQYHETKIKFPWNFKGFQLEEPHFRYLPHRLILTQKITMYQFALNFYKLIQQYLDHLDKRDWKNLSEICEETFFRNLYEITKGLDFEIKKNEESPYFSKEKAEINVIDAIVYRGVCQDRSKNLSFKDFHCFQDPLIGVVAFTPLAFQDAHVQSNQKKIEELHLISRRSLCQVQVQARTPYQLTIKNEELKQNYSENYNWCQEFTFETDLIIPEKFNNPAKSEDYVEWMSKHKFSQWKIVDVSRWLGPALFNEQKQ